MEPVIELRSITKSYGNFKVLDNVTLAIEKGIIFGLLGPNGAGKSTLIKILSCQSRPSSGHAFISGLDVVSDKKDILQLSELSPRRTVSTMSLL